MDNGFIWNEIQKLSDTKTYFVQERDSPALIGEVTGYNVNDSIRVNLRTRFPYLLDVTKKVNEYDEVNKTMPDWELDLFLHLYAHLDLLSGYNINNEMIDEIRYKIENELYGSEVATYFKKLGANDQNSILRNLCSSRRGLLSSLKNVFKELYPEGLIYRRQNVIYVYIDRDWNQEDDNKFELLKNLFIPIHMTLEVHYKYHMGIIGIEETMVIGKIRIV